MKMTDLDVALKIAEIAHEGQTYGVEPYLERHVLDVLARVQWETNDPDAHVVAVLHDCVEDSSLTVADMAWFGVRVQRAVDAITRRENESRLDYLDRVKADDLALLVKRCDLESNIAAGGPRVRKYKSALDHLRWPTTCVGYD